MGLYVNPDGMTKEAWLDRNALAEISPEEMVRNHAKLIAERMVPMVWINNGPFTALAVGYSSREVADFARPDPRPKRYLVVGRDSLAQESSGVGESALAAHGI